MTALLLSAIIALGASVAPPSEAREYDPPSATDRPLGLRGASHHVLGAPSHPSAPILAARSGRDSSDGAPSGVRTGRTGTWTHMGDGYPASYLALPIGPGHRVKACGPAKCLTLTSTDAGPARSALLRGVIGDLSVELFHDLCGCDPWLRGTFQGSWKLLGPAIRLPDTSTEGSAQ